MNMKRVDHYITPKQLKMLKKMSKDTGLTVSDLIRRAIDEIYSSKNKKS